ncbi:chaperone modulator CbpM [Pleomorphomonas sp. PLEO]|uniref:chaperone modulator CbpM n=1 Tax=Pleomorphomonas sp. PLEO TaxID=3239306 RepID=UPI00351EF52E
MIDIDVLIAREPGLSRQDLDQWISDEWVRADRTADQWTFQEIDVARVRLIRTLREDMAIDDDVLPLVLSLLDQIYDMRRRLHRLAAVERGGAKTYE